MKKILLFLAFLLMSIGAFCSGIDTIYNENFGSNTTSSNRTFQFSYFSDSKTNEIILTTWNQGRNSVNPSNFSGASGLACAQTSTSSATLILIFGNLSSYTNVTLSFGYRNDASQKGARTFTTHVSANGGTTWTEIDCNKSRTTQTWEKIIYSVPNALLNNFAIKFTNTAGNNSRVDDIILTGNSTTPSPTTYSVTYNLNGGSGTLPTESNKAKDETFTLHNGTTGITAPDCKTFSKWKDQDNVIYNGSATYTMPAKNVTLTAQWVDVPLYTVSFNNAIGDNPNSITQPNCTTGVTLPTPTFSSICENDGWEFAGWSESNLSYSNLKTGTYIPTQNITLYAVYKKSVGEGGGDYILVEEDLENWTGDYLIAYSPSIFADGRIGGKDDSGSMGSSGIYVNPDTYLSGKIVDGDWGDLYNITLEPIDEGYVMITKDGKYNYHTSGTSNGLSTTNNIATASNYPLSITFNSSSDIDIAISAGAVFHYNADGFFRFYQNGGQNNIYLYKKQGAYDYSFNPSCCENTITINKFSTENGSFDLSTNTICGDGDGGEVEIINIVPDDGYMLDTILAIDTVNMTIVGTTNMAEHKITGIKTSCVVVAVFTQLPPKPEIDIIEWNPDYIKVDIDNFDAVTAVIENKNTQEIHDDNVATNLFFSKYFEAAANIKLWAIYNGTKDTISLTNVKVLVSSNGNVWDETNANKVTHLDTLGRIKCGYICPNEEIIVYNDGDNSGTDVTIMECIKEKYDISNWYMISNNTTSFSGDDGLLLLNGTDTLDIIGIMEPDYFTVGSGQSAKNHSIGTINNPHGDDYGWYCENGKTINGDSTTLSTNRCLLIRKNTVHSGDSAIKYNRTNFVTLCDEWVGEVVEKHQGDPSADANQTCEDFSYVGSYDYNAYYAQYTEIVNELQLSSILQDDGTYKIDIQDLDTLSCTYLKVIVSDNNKTEECEYKIPIFVSNTVASTAELFTKEGADCPECDVIILNGGKLTINDDFTSRDVTVYPGGVLIIPENTIYNVNSLTLLRENNTVPYFSYKGILNFSDKFNVDLRTDANEWRWMTLPFSHKVSDIRYPNGKKPLLNNEIYVSYYDGKYRSINKKSAWKDIETDSTFNAGEGFLFGVDLPGQSKKTYRFSFNNIEAEKSNKTISNLFAWGGNNPDLAPNHKGWNLVGNPFMDSDTTDIIDPIRIGRLKKDSINGHWTGGWVSDTIEDVHGKKLRYAVVPSKDPEDASAGGYKSVVLDDYILQPLTSFFVQIGGNEDNMQTLTFKPEKRINRIVTRRTLINEKDEELFLRIKIGDKKTGCFISNQFNENYEPGDDLESRYAYYQLINGYKLLYSAINDSIIENGVLIHSAGGKVTLDPKVETEKFEQIYILYNNSWYDLLHGDEPEVSGDFVLYGKRKIQENITTDIENIKPGQGTYKFLYENNIFINSKGKIYNALGTLVK